MFSMTTTLLKTPADKPNEAIFLRLGLNSNLGILEDKVFFNLIELYFLPSYILITLLNGPEIKLASIDYDLSGRRSLASSRYVC